MPIISSTNGYSLLWQFGSGTPPQNNTFPTQLGDDFNDVATALTTINQALAPISTGGTATQVLHGAGSGYSSVVYADIQNVGASSLLGNPTGSPAAVSQITLGANLSFSGTTLVATVPAQNFAYLGTVSVSGGVISDTTILAANNSTYRSFLFILKDILCGTSNASLTLQVHSGGIFQSTGYVFVYSGDNGSGATRSGTAAATVAQITICPNAQNAAPGICGQMRVGNLSGTSTPKQWFGQTTFNSTANTDTMGVFSFGGAWKGGNGAVDGFQLAASTGTLSSGSTDIYGLT